MSEGGRSERWRSSPRGRRRWLPARGHPGSAGAPPPRTQSTSSSDALAFESIPTPPSSARGVLCAVRRCSQGAGLPSVPVHPPRHRPSHADAILDRCSFVASRKAKSIRLTKNLERPRLKLCSNFERRGADASNTGPTGAPRRRAGHLQPKPWW